MLYFYIFFCMFTSPPPLFLSLLQAEQKEQKADLAQLELISNKAFSAKSMQVMYCCPFNSARVVQTFPTKRQFISRDVDGGKIYRRCNNEEEIYVGEG